LTWIHVVIFEGLNFRVHKICQILQGWFIPYFDKQSLGDREVIFSWESHRSLKLVKI
jgi:hypothetical protein